MLLVTFDEEEMISPSLTIAEKDITRVGLARRAKLLHMPALLLKRAGGEALLSAERARIEGQFGRFFHNDDELRGRTRVAAKGQQAMVSQQDCRDCWMKLKLANDIAYRFW